MPMNRRDVLLWAAGPALAGAADRIYSVASGLRPAVPPEGRVPFGWRARPIEDELRLSFQGGGSRLRITNAVDSREFRTVEARTSRSHVPLGVIEMRYAYMLQLFELVLEPGLAKKAAAEGVTLRRTSGAAPVWLFAGGAPAPLLPHLMRTPASKPAAEFDRRLRGIESVQPFGWLEGCVLDALDDLGYASSVDAHLRLFLHDRESLVYEDPRSSPADNRLSNIEVTLPFAVMARRMPDHSSINTAVAFWMQSRDREGCIVTGGLTSAEGSYTVAYPLAVVGRLRGDRAFEDLALRQLRLRRDRLVAPEGLYLRRNAKGEHTYKSWARGVAWYSLGLARTLEVLPDREDARDLRMELRRVVDWVLHRQRPDGLWNCFLDEPETGPDTSGSAGIAAAMAKAVRTGFHDGSGGGAPNRGRSGNLAHAGRLCGRRRAKQSRRRGFAAERLPRHLADGNGPVRPTARRVETCLRGVLTSRWAESPPPSRERAPQESESVTVPERESEEPGWHARRRNGNRTRHRRLASPPPGQTSAPPNNGLRLQPAASRAESGVRLRAEGG